LSIGQNNVTSCKRS